MRILIVLLFASTAQAQELHKHPTLLKMLKENNRLREQEKLISHVMSPSLTKAAQNQAWYMARTHDFEHKTKDNGTPGIRAAKHGFSGTVRENIGRGIPNITKIFEQWKKSPTHWKSVVGDFTEVGFGYAIAKDGTKYWVALYGSPRKLETWKIPKTQKLPVSRGFIFPSSKNFLSPRIIKGQAFLLISS